MLTEIIQAASRGDAATLKRLIARDSESATRWSSYTPPIHFAVRGRHLECVRLLIAAGADPEWNGYHDGSLIEMARYRRYNEIARVLEEECRRKGRIAPDKGHQEHPIHAAAQADDVARVREFLDADASLLERGDAIGGSPLHRAVLGSARHVVPLLLDRGANIHAIHSTKRGWPVDLQAIDLAIWGANMYAWPKRDFGIARLLLERGAERDLTIAAALGDIGRVTALLDQDASSVAKARANGKRPLSTAIEFGHRAIAVLLLERGADPLWPEIGAERGAALHTAARLGDRELVELLLERGADPNSHVDSAGNAVYAAKTEEIRALFGPRGGELDPYDLVWMDRDDEVMRIVAEDPASAERGCGGVFTAVCTRGKRELLMRLLEAGVPPPRKVGGCRSYLLEDIGMLRVLLAHGMSPDLADSQGNTFLHGLCGTSRRCETEAIERAAILLDAGASISPREEEYSSTPLGFAARSDMPRMVEFLISRGAPLELPDDEAWATPVAWALWKGNAEVVEILRRYGASQ